MGLASNLKIWRGPAPPSSEGPARRRAWGWRSLGGLIAAWILLGTLWETGARLGVLNPAIFPPPSQFIPYLIETSGSVGLGVNKVSYLASLVETVIRVGIGFGLGVGGGLIVGTLLSAIPLARVIGVPIAQILAPIAPIAWIPLAIVLFGTGDGAAVFVVFMGIAASMTLATVAALGSVPGSMRSAIPSATRLPASSAAANACTTRCGWRRAWPPVHARRSCSPAKRAPARSSSRAEFTHGATRRASRLSQ